MPAVKIHNPCIVENMDVFTGNKEIYLVDYYLYSLASYVMRVHIKHSLSNKILNLRPKCINAKSCIWDSIRELKLAKQLNVAYIKSIMNIFYRKFTIYCLCEFNESFQTDNKFLT